jgi:3-isopropylmalate dehydrogenase
VIAVLPGDGIGPEVTDAALTVLAAVERRFGRRFETRTWPIGGAAIDLYGEPLPAATLAGCRSAAAVLLGAVGGPRWDDAPKRPEAGLLVLRRELGVYANLRPLKLLPGLAEHSPLKPERLAGVDLLIVRELLGGLYYGEPRGRSGEKGNLRANDSCVYHEAEIRRVVTLAFRLAAARRGRVTSVDKANVLETSRLWRQVATEVAQDFPAVRLDHALVDSFAMRLVLAPAEIDVVVTENLFGDILSDEAGALAGTLGVLPSASLGDRGPGLYEPVHGSAPDLAGRGLANPVGAILSLALALRHSLECATEATAVEAAVETVLASGVRTGDLGGAASTEAFTAEVVHALALP